VDSFRRDGLTFDVRDAGPVDGEPVVLLHGFPQDSSAWDRVVPVLHGAGLRTLAPDQRGYSPMARPRGRAAYRLRELVADVLALLDTAALERAHSAGRSPRGTRTGSAPSPCSPRRTPARWRRPW
jgi:pimeloyl-ACP methyl ester carboxylesterase